MRSMLSDKDSGIKEMLKIINNPFGVDSPELSKTIVESNAK